MPIERIGIDDLDAMTVDWSSYDISNPEGLQATARHILRPHQVVAVEKVRAGFGERDRGKLIMACGTGKTFTALRIAEEHAGAGRSVLFLAPSIALVAQSLREWTAECEIPIRPRLLIARPSRVQIGRYAARDETRRGNATSTTSVYSRDRGEAQD